MKNGFSISGFMRDVIIIKLKVIIYTMIGWLNIDVKIKCECCLEGFGSHSKACSNEELIHTRNKFIRSVLFSSNA